MYKMGFALLWLSLSFLSQAMDVLIVHDAGYDSEDFLYTPEAVEGELEFLKRSGYDPVLGDSDEGIHGCVISVATHGSCESDFTTTIRMEHPSKIWLASGSNYHFGVSGRDSCSHGRMWAALKGALFSAESRMNILWNLRRECGVPPTKQ